MTQKNNFNAKKVIAGLVAAGVLASGSMVFAEYDPNKVIDTSVEYTTLSAEGDSHAPVEYNGATLLAGTAAVDGHTMFPVRYVFETLGYEVTWVDEGQKIQLNRGAVEIGMYIGQDSYYFAKTMPAPLGAAPALIDGETTYAPIELLTDIAGVKVLDNGDESIMIIDSASVSFQSIETDESNLTYLTVNDALRGEVIVFVSEDTEITVNGEKGSIDDLSGLKSNQVFKIGYDAAMTMSLPPQTTAITIDITTAPADAASAPEAETDYIEAVEFSGLISEVEEDRIIINDNGTVRALTISDETIISHGNDKRIYKIDDLTVGTEVKGVRDAIETRSIPPISNAVSVEILNFAE